MSQTKTVANHNQANQSNQSALLSNVLVMDKFCSCLELWKGCILAGIFTMSTSVFDLLWSIAHMIDEETVIFFYLLFSLGIESVLFIAATGLLFIALIKRSKCLLLPWLLMAFVDVFFSLLVSFAELAIPSNLQSSGCTVPAVSMVVTLLVCFITIYCWLCVYGQYLNYAKNMASVADIKVAPIDDHGQTPINTGSIQARSHHPSQQPSQQQQQQPGFMDQTTQQSQHPNLNNLNSLHNNQGNTSPIETLQVPQVSTPRDAW